MKLLLYSHFFAPSIGGVETIVLTLAKGLSEYKGERFEVTVVTQTAAEEFPDGELPFSVVRRPATRRLWRLIRESDVIHVSGPALQPMLFTKLAHKPLVVEHHGFQTICPNGQLLIEPSTPCPGHFMARNHRACLRCNSHLGWSASLRLWLLTFVRRLLCRRASINIAPTAWAGGLLRLPRTAPVPHGIERSLPLPRSTPREAPVIAFQGRLVTTKGAKVLLDAAKILRDQGRVFEIVVIGDGPERANLEKIAQQQQLSGCAHFLGCVSPDALDSALRRAAMVVVPSLGGEVFGLVVAENMARSLPIIASDIGAFTEVLGGAGLTFKTGDAIDLARRLAKLLDDPALAAHLGQTASQRVLRYGVGQMIAAHANIYVRLIGTTGRPSRSDVLDKAEA